MTASAVFMMVITILLVWGGLVASMVALRNLPVPGDEADRTPRETPSASVDEEPLRHGPVPDNI